LEIKLFEAYGIVVFSSSVKRSMMILAMNFPQKFMTYFQEIFHDTFRMKENDVSNAEHGQNFEDIV